MEERIVVAETFNKVMDEMFAYGGELIGKYMLNDINTLANAEADDVKEFQRMLQLAQQLKASASMMALQMDQQNRMIFELKKQNDEIIKKLDKLTSK